MGVPRKRTFVIRNGTTASHARPSNVSISSRSEISARSVSASTGQCAKRRSCQLCVITHGPAGRGHGRCATSRNISFSICFTCCSTVSFCEYTLPACRRIEFSDYETDEKRKRRETCSARDRKSTRLNSSHSQISYAVFCLKKKKKNK